MQTVTEARFMRDFPEDTDGDVLRSIEEHGSDMDKPMFIEFTIVVPNNDKAKAMAELIAPLGYAPEIYFDEKSETWSLYCGKSMLATHDNVVEAQAELNEVVAPHGGNCDGWVTGGNRHN